MTYEKDERRTVLAVGDCIDEPADRAALMRGLFRRGLHLVEVPGQAEALAFLFEAAPGLVLIDLGLTRGTPIAVADMAAERYPDTPVIFVAGGGMVWHDVDTQMRSNVAAQIPPGMSAPDMLALIAHHAQSGVLPEF